MYELGRMTYDTRQNECVDHVREDGDSQAAHLEGPVILGQCYYPMLMLDSKNIR